MIVEDASTSQTAIRGQRLLMTAAIVVATAAGIVGAIMLVAPTSTGTYFAWPLGPPGLAALVGGFYVVSAPVFAYAGTRPAVEVRGLAAAVLAFTVPTLVATYLHRDIFDFSRLMAIAWVVLFIASPITFCAVVMVGPACSPTAERPSPQPRYTHPSSRICYRVRRPRRLVLGHHRRSNPLRGGASRCPLPCCLARILRSARRLAGPPACPLRSKSATSVPRRVRRRRTARGCRPPGTVRG